MQISILLPYLTLGIMEWGILIDPLVDRYTFEGSLIQEDVRLVSDSFARW